MADILRFPVRQEPIEQSGPHHNPEALIEYPSDAARAAHQAVRDMLEHFDGADLDLSEDSYRVAAAVVDEYEIDSVVTLMGESTKDQWMKRPAFFGALGFRFLTEVLGGEYPSRDYRPGPDGLFLLPSPSSP